MTALYVYGIVDTGPPATLADGQAVGGAPGDAIEWLTEPDLPVSAVVSPAPDDLRGKRRDLLAHQRVLDLLAERGPVLPMRFGVVSPDEQTLLASLRGNAQHYTELLRELAGRVELNVKALPDEQQFIASASNDPAVRGALQAARRDGSRERQVQLGQAVAAAVAQRRQLCAAQLLDRLRPLASRTSTLGSSEKYVLNAAFLVERSAVDRFGSTVDELREQLSPAVDLVLTGPLPPYSFVAG
jgi:hypothetical protein